MELVRKTGNWHSLAGVTDPGAAEAQLDLFWQRYRELRPNHQAFGLEKTHGLVLSRTLPLMMHGDEGRSQKRKAVMILSCHSALGKGVQTKKKRPLDHQLTEQQLNYIGLTAVTRILLAVIPKQYYEAGDGEGFHIVLEHLAKDIGRVSREGIVLDGVRYWACPISMKGDWPFLHKSASLTRSFYNQPKKGQAAKPCVGICHLCLAGQETGDIPIPFEDVSHSAEWQFHMGVEKPWIERPVILNYLTHDPDFEESFFAPDIWHSWHLGEGRGFSCNMVKLLSETVPGRNLELRLAFLFENYREFCRRQGVQVYATRFTPALFNIVSNDFPSGGWTKGNFTTSLVKWLSWYLNFHRNEFPRGGYLDLAETHSK